MYYGLLKVLYLLILVFLGVHSKGITSMLLLNARVTIWDVDDSGGKVRVLNPCGVVCVLQDELNFMQLY